MISQAELVDRIDRIEAVSKRARPLLMLGLIAITAGFIILSIYLDNARREANAIAMEQRKLANESATTLEAVRAALIAGNQADAFRLLRIAINQQEVVAAAPLPDTQGGEKPIAAPVPSEQPQVTKVLKKAARNKGSSLSLPPYAEAGNRAVFIQFAGNIPRRQIVELNQALRQAGWNVQGASGERIATAAGLNEVRYSSEQDQAAAQALAATIAKAGIGNRPTSARQLDIIRPGTLEVWISR